MRLFHFTCDHGAAKIGRRGTLRPNPQPMLQGLPLVWLTDLDTADKDALGLTSTFTPCDRTRFRYVVTAPCVWWPDFVADGHVDQAIASHLETYRQPEHWWVSPEPVEARMG